MKHAEGDEMTGMKIGPLLARNSLNSLVCRTDVLDSFKEEEDGYGNDTQIN